MNEQIRSLLSEVQANLVDESVTLVTILRKASILANRLGSADFRAWTDSELNGYGENESVPDYRRFQTQSYGDFSGPYGKMVSNALIHTHNVPELTEFARNVTLHQGISTIESLIKEKGDTIRTVWPPEAVFLVSRKVYQNLVCHNAYHILSKSNLNQVIDSVRNGLLRMTLEIDDLYEKASVEHRSSVRAEEVEQVFNTYVYGSDNVIAAGKQFTQNVWQPDKGKLDELNRELGELGVDQADIEEITEIVKKEPQGDSKQFGQRASAWIGKMITKLANGAWKATTDAAPTLLVKYLAKVYELGS